MFKNYTDGPPLDPLSWEQSQTTLPVIAYPPPDPSSGCAIYPQPDPSMAFALAENPPQEPESW